MSYSDILPGATGACKRENFFSAQLWPPGRRSSYFINPDTSCHSVEELGPLYKSGNAANATVTVLLPRYAGCACLI
ncbi:hypothetical protein EV129_106168 [Rhizobium azibense]|uniref:Uncharacterized protein n=1 Tax=Rhizobium azibense TaxID=1136135 RepID=A0A4R3RZ88_9HYPH|nr:hypothetical protein EV129_106168 [Rhizobium azibense]